MHIRIILKFFEKCKCSDTASFSRAPEVFSKQSCLKATGIYYDVLILSSLFHLFYFIFSAPTSFSLFSNFSIFSLSLCFFSILYCKHSRKAFAYILYKYVYNTYIIESINFCLTKKIVTF